MLTPSISHANLVPRTVPKENPERSIEDVIQR